MAQIRKDLDSGSDKGRSARWKAALILGIALVALALVVLFGWYQFSYRAGDPIGIVKDHRIPGSGETVGRGIRRFIEDKGVTISEEFKPRWGAEESNSDLFMVSYVYEVGRETKWISWQVDMASGKVTPRDEWARELWEGRER